MNITGKIKGIEYNVLLSDNNLTEIEISDFDINQVPATCIVKDNKYNFAVSKWVSPKRTRSYPFERVYNSLHIAKKITIIPVIKDEGARGDRDYIQWDTVSLMSLLDVFVIFAYYDAAKINPRNSKKITTQQFNNKYVVSKIKEIENYHSSALHWNVNELNTNFYNIVDIAQQAYYKIEKQTGVKLHHADGLENFKTKIGNHISTFMKFSREKAEKAQSREFVTIQPKESLSTLSKAKITITNYLGGQYFFTVDEIAVTEKIIKLIEGKHCKSSLLPSLSDIKDGLLKMILYSNLVEVTANGAKIKSEAILSLTSQKLKGKASSASTDEEIKTFLKENKFSISQQQLINLLFEEARQNEFVIQIQFSK